MIRNNSVLFATIALVAIIAMAGTASAIEPVSGDVNSTVAEGNVVTLTVEGGTPGRYVTAVVGTNAPLDDYAYGNIDPLLVDAGIVAGGMYNATIVMLCSGTQRTEDGIMGDSYTNTLRNTTPTTAYIINAVRNGATDFASLMELESCPMIIDLNVSEISVNPSCGAGVLRSNTTNDICAKIWNNGTAAAGEFNASFVVTGSPGSYSKEVTVTGGLGAGNNTTVCITDYQPTSPGAVTITVTADCNFAVGESDEGNNSMVESATVYNNGYMGKRLTGGEDINLVTKEEGKIDLKYAVCNATTYVNGTGTQHDFGDNQTYLGGSAYPNWTEYRARWDKDPQLPIPSGETIRKATLYVYYSTSYYPVPDFNVSFNEMNYTMADAVHRTDVKGWPSTSEYGNAPSGMLTYNVTSEFDNTTNTMVVYNLLEPGSPAPPATKHQITLQGAVLAVVYEHSSEPERIIYVNEGFDLLAGTSYSCCTPDEATAYADFLNVPNPALFMNATLVTISTGATKGPGNNKLFFNSEEWDGGLKNGTFPTEEGWAPPAVASWMDITANETDVLGPLSEGSNTAKFQDSGDLLCMANAFLKLEKGEGLKPDLNVSEISVNPSCKPGTLRANTTNDICAKIWNNGTAAAGEFNASFVVTGSPGSYSKEVTVTGGIPAGNNTTVCITDYQPTSPGAVTITVTADCNLAVGESDEGNNSMVESATVYNNGYMGKRLTGGEDINPVTKEEGKIDLKYAVCNATTYVNGTGTQHDFGDNQTYLGGSAYPNWTEYRARWDKDPQLPIPSGETIRKATLYVYYSTSYYPVPDFNVSFNEMNYTMADAVHRTDVKGWPSTSEYGNAPSGMLTYNVTSEFDNTTNTMVVYNLLEPGSPAPPATKHQITLQGAVLAVVYEHSSEPERIIYVNEGFDLLAGTSYSCCTPDEATAYADFLGVLSPSLLEDATLITISTGADKDVNKLFFNNDEWDGGLKNGTFPTDAGWAPPTDGGYMDITANETDVLGSLLEGSNTAKFQDSGDLLCMANAFLKLEKGEGPKPELHHINVTPTSETLNINESCNFTAAGFDQNNGTVPDLVFEWDISDAYVGSLTPVNDTATNFTAKHTGITYLTASNGSVTSDSVQVTVNAPTNTTKVSGGNATATSGDSTAIVKLDNVSVTGEINVTEIGDPVNSTTANGSTAGLGTGVELIKGVNITASANVTGALANDTNRTSWIHIKIEYNGSRLGNIDESTLFIYKYVNGSGWVKLVSGSNNCTANGRNTAANYVWANVTHLCDFGVGGSAPAGSSGSSGSGGRGGTYPPGWFGTPTPTVTATKAPAASATATAAPPGERVTPAPTKAKPDAAKTATPAAKETAAGTPAKGAPGFTAVFVIAGVLAVAYAMMRRRG